jgi:hypothetical protein
MLFDCRRKFLKLWGPGVSAGAAEAAPLECLDHCGVNTAGNWGAGRLEMGMLFHAMISVIRSEGDAPGKRAELKIAD